MMIHAAQVPGMDGARGWNAVAVTTDAVRPGPRATARRARLREWLVVGVMLVEIGMLVAGVRHALPSTWGASPAGSVAFMWPPL